MTSVTSQVAEEARPHAARLSQAAASGTGAVFQCFAAQAHAALLGLMHVRCPPPSPLPVRHPGLLSSSGVVAYSCEVSDLRAATEVQRDRLWSEHQLVCSLPCRFLFGSLPAATELQLNRALPYCSILLLPADLTGVQQPLLATTASADVHAAPPQRPQPKAGAAGFPLAEDIDRGGVGGASPPKRQGSAASSAGSAGSNSGGRRTAAGSQGSAGRPPPVPGGAGTSAIPCPWRACRWQESGNTRPLPKEAHPRRRTLLCICTRNCAADNARA